MGEQSGSIDGLAQATPEVYVFNRTESARKTVNIPTAGISQRLIEVPPTVL
jgi:hypothetical protein